jgi:hypothetical protein
MLNHGAPVLAIAANDEPAAQRSGRLDQLVEKRTCFLCIEVRQRDCRLEPINCLNGSRNISRGQNIPAREINLELLSHTLAERS